PDNGRNEHGPEPDFPEVLKCFPVDRKERVRLGGYTVKMQVNRIEAGVLEFLGKTRIFCELYTVCRDLHLGEPDCLGLPYDIRQVIPHRGFPAGELHRRGWD